MNANIETACMIDPGAEDDSHIWPPCPSPEEIELGMEEQGEPLPKRKLEEWIVAYEKRRAFLLKDSTEIAGIEANDVAHAEVLAQQLAENRAHLAETDRRLKWCRFQLANRN